jgi:hypothetical protein
MDVVHEVEKGHVIVTNGPYLEVSLRADDAAKKSEPAALPGDNIALPGGKGTLSVRVQCPNWLDVNRVQVFVNGQARKELSFSRRENGQQFKDGVVKFAAEIPLVLEKDAHIIVATIGEGLSLGPVMGPERGKDVPAAVANPIFVDVDGKGFQPNGDLLGFPLPIKSQKHDHDHDHEHDDHDHKHR